MRSDVKVGLICAFAIVLAVIIYFVAQGNGHPARAANTTVTSTLDTNQFKVTAPAAAPTPVPAATPGTRADRSSFPQLPVTRVLLSNRYSFRHAAVPSSKSPLHRCDRAALCCGVQLRRRR